MRRASTNIYLGDTATEGEEEQEGARIRGRKASKGEEGGEGERGGKTGAMHKSAQPKGRSKESTWQRSERDLALKHRRRKRTGGSDDPSPPAYRRPPQPPPPAAAAARPPPPARLDHRSPALTTARCDPRASFPPSRSSVLSPLPPAPQVRHHLGPARPRRRRRPRGLTSAPPVSRAPSRAASMHRPRRRVPGPARDGAARARVVCGAAQGGGR